jgi:predicted ester cyclase/2-polyprenyl-3-methyl-5-hydroxy-6-metoxy-1,4-benzoquinol methylase
MTAENKSLVRRFYEEIDKGNLAAIDELVAYDYVDHSPPPFPGLSPGREGVKQAFELFWEATPGYHRIDDQIAEGDKVVTRLTAIGLHEGDLPGIPKTGNKLEMTAIVIHRIADGKLVEKWSNKDVLGFLQQLGVIPQPISNQSYSMSQPTPELFIDTVFAYQKTAAIKAAIGLGMFTAIGNEAKTVEAISKSMGAAPKGVRVLCDYLTVQGFFKKQGDRYELTEASHVFLDGRSPAYMGGVVDFMASPELIRTFLEDPVAYVRNGGATGSATLDPDHPLWVTFAKAMVPFMAPLAQAVAEQVANWSPAPRKVLDIAAGHGMFGIAVGKAVPQAEIVAVDWEPVLAVAKENAEKAGIADRYRTIAGSAFEVEYGSDYDLILLPNFLHHFDKETCVALLKKVKESLKPAGKVLAVEFVPNEDRVSPYMPACFAFIMLAHTPSGDAYTAAELKAMALAAGFTNSTTAPLANSPQSLATFES